MVHEAHRCKTVYVASLQVTTAFDVANPGIIADIIEGDGSDAGGYQGPEGDGQL